MKIVSAYLFFFATAVAAQTPWPASMPNLNAGGSTSPVSAVIPAGLSVETPSSDVPADLARWSGQWNGWADRGRAADTRLIVEKVTATGATVTYVFASSYVNPSYSERAQAKFVGDELQAVLTNGAKVTYRLRTDGKVMEFLYTNPPGQGRNSWGVLSK